MAIHPKKLLLTSFIGLSVLALSACTETAETSFSENSSATSISEPLNNQNTTGGPAQPEEDTSSDVTDQATVVRIVDGDTLILEIDGIEEKVRLIGINTPESVKQNAPKECYGEEASQYLSTLLPQGSTVRIERDVEARDQYDRLLLYVYRQTDDLFVNESLVAEGFAEAKSYRPNTTRQDELFQALQSAQENKKGLWKSCDGPHQPLP